MKDKQHATETTSDSIKACLTKPVQTNVSSSREEEYLGIRILENENSCSSLGKDDTLVIADAALKNTC